MRIWLVLVLCGPGNRASIFGSCDQGQANFSMLGVADFRCYEGFADVVDRQLGGAFFFEEAYTNDLIGDS